MKKSFFLVFCGLFFIFPIIVLNPRKIIGGNGYELEIYYPTDFDVMGWGPSENEFTGFYKINDYYGSLLPAIWNKKTDEITMISENQFSFLKGYSLTDYSGKVGGITQFRPDYCKVSNEILYYSLDDFEYPGTGLINLDTGEKKYLVDGINAKWDWNCKKIYFSRSVNGDYGIYSFDLASNDEMKIAYFPKSKVPRRSFASNHLAFEPSISSSLVALMYSKDLGELINPSTLETLDFFDFYSTEKPEGISVVDYFKIETLMKEDKWIVLSQDSHYLWAGVQVVAYNFERDCHTIQLRNFIPEESISYIYHVEWSEDYQKLLISGEKDSESVLIIISAEDILNKWLESGTCDTKIVYEPLIISSCFNPNITIPIEKFSGRNPGQIDLKFFCN